jgi:predicted RNase H-like nuclease (RuvC/YqgF family)
MAEAAASLPAEVAVDGHLTAVRRDGDLHVMMDVGLAGELGMSVTDLKEAIHSVSILTTQVSELKKTLNGKSTILTSTEKQLEEVTKELEEIKTKMRADNERLKLDVEQNNRAAEEEKEQLTKELEEIKTKMRADNERLKQDVEQNNRAAENLREGMERNAEDLETLKSKFDDQANEEVEEVDEGEPGIALEDQLRITEQSAKAIDLLSNHLLSTVFQTCSKNTFGNQNVSVK